MKLKLILYLCIITIITTTTLAATLKGSIYNEQLEREPNVVVEINTTPLQKYLAKDGSYMFELPPGKYLLSARKETTEITENIKIIQEGTYIYDLFLLDTFVEEDELWDTGNEINPAEAETDNSPRTWAYVTAGIIFAIAIIRIIHARKKYGPLKLFRKKIQQEAQKTVEQHKEEISKEPSYLETTLEIIKKHHGRIYQKELRKEMLYLSEAKVSLIITELEHKGKVEKIKKGRGNVIILKNPSSPEQKSDHS